jgi:hypothetical protein
VPELESLLPSTDELEANIAGFDRAAVVFLSGSLIAGFGHANSDVDVYVCFASAADLTAVTTEADTVREPLTGAPVAAFYVGETRWDVEFVAAGDVDSAIAKVEELDESDDPAVSEHEIDLLSRLSVAAPVKGVEQLEAWKSRLQASRLSSVLAARYLTAADGHVEDALGLLEVDDVPTAAYCARLAFELGTDALLAAEGRYWPTPKWRIAQLRRGPAGSVDLEEYLAVTEMRALDGRAWVERVVDRVREFPLEL